MIRDPRDVVVSEAHYLAANRSHRLHELFSGQATTVDLLSRARAQGYDFQLLAKPVHPERLLAKLADLRSA